MDPVTRLLAIEDIKQLKSRYFQALDFKDWDGYAALFTPDAVIDFSQQPDLIEHGRDEAAPDPSDWIFSGGRAAADFIDPLFVNVVSAHHGHDPQIELIDEDHATGYWALYDRLEFEDEIYHGFGHYRERYVRTGGEWKFAELVLTRVANAWEQKTAVAAANR